MKGTSTRPSWLQSTHLLEALADGVFALEATGQIIYLSASALALVGVKEEEVLGGALTSLVTDEHQEALRGQLEEVAAGRPGLLDCQISRPDGHGPWVRLSISAVQADGAVVGALASATNIADFREAFVKQRESQAQFDAVFQSLPFECWLMERDGSFVMQNQQSMARLGSVASKKLDSAVFPEEMLREFQTDLAVANAGREARRDLTLSLEGGRRYFNRLLVPIRNGEEILGVLGVCVDTTERRNLEDQLAQSQKLDAVGRLAGGIAHDFNNVLTAIMSCVRLLERRLEGPPRRELQIIRDGAQRASELTRQLLAFSKQEMMEPRRTSIDDVVVKSDRLLRRLIGEDIELVTEAEAEGWDVVVDSVRLEQAIINLVVNARDALPRGGKITVRSSGVELSASQPVADGLMPPGSYALIVVADSGVGMSEDTKARAFEPFFTTRQEAGGTGLGLSSVYGSVHQSKGYITLTSALGEGTTVALYLPRAEGDVAVAAPAEVEVAAAGGSETILLVEDEAMVMSVTCQALRLSGYTVLEARGLEAALEVAAAHSGTIDLLLTDVVMPRGTGPELAASLREQRPGIAVLFMSGYDAERIDIEVDEVSFLAKPFSPDRLDLQVRKVLDARAVSEE